MAELQYRARAFKPPFTHLNTPPGWARLQVRPAALLHAAVTVGREHWSAVYAHPPYSTYEVEFRTNVIRAFLMEHRERRPGFPARQLWAASPAYGRESPASTISSAPGLEASEKGAVSFFLGMTATSLFADRFLGVPWILHESVYARRLGITAPAGAGRSRPDFVGFDPSSSQWFQFEAKGRSSQLAGRARTDLEAAAKRQAAVKLAFRGQVAVLNVTSILDFDQGLLRVDWADPPELAEGDSLDLDITPTAFLLEYYRLLVDYLGDEPVEYLSEVTNHRVKGAVIPHADLRISLDASIYDSARDHNGERLLLELSQPRDRVDQPGVYYGLDGFMIELGPSDLNVPTPRRYVGPVPTPRMHTHTGEMPARP